MNIEKILNEIQNPFTEQLTEDEFDIVTEVHHLLEKLYLNNSITLDWRHNDEYWIRPIFEAMNCEIGIVEDEDGTDCGISIYRKNVKL